MKKGVSMFPFLMIFVLIAGAIFIFFFFNFGTDILNISGKLNKGQTLKNLDQQLAAFSLASNADAELNLGLKANIKTECNNDGLNKKINLVFDDFTYETQKFVLAPSEVQGRTIKAWTFSWDYPFKVENLYFLADDNFNLYYRAPTLTTELEKLRDDFLRNFPNRIKPAKLDGTTTILSSPTLTNVVILFNSVPGIEASYTSSNTKVVKVTLDEPDDYLDGIKEVQICDPSCQSAGSLGLAMAYAAIFAPSFDDYTCIKDKIIERLGTIIDIYDKKVSKLVDPICQSDYNIIARNDLLIKLRDPENNQQAATDLEQLNRNLDLQGCPRIYLK